ncbi:MAG TPA: pitrilysin family protein [Bacteroidia bacterium]|jgi:zinc protease|nr:pitrilysin family protein [Bacteroidia bacterium]
MRKSILTNLTGFVLLLTSIFLVPFRAKAFTYPTFDKTLKNGLKVIVCEKPGTGFAEVEVWYRVGSKDEHDGIRGMAHMFEHMMFRGTKNISGVELMEKLDSVGADWNAYTTFDRTVYHEYVPSTAVSMSMMLEADRMANLNVTQDVLNTERQVVGEEYRNGISNWYQKMSQDRYGSLYPDGHPYQYDVIGHLDEIVNFTAPQCMEFYDKYYSPNNAFVVIVGDVKHDDVFADAEKYFGVITKQLPAATAGPAPDLFTSHVKVTDLDLNYPLQDYCYAIPQPATSDPDYFAYDMLTSLFFTDANSVLNERLDKKEHLVYAIIQSNETEDLFPSRATFDIFMPPMPGNVKVKREIRAEMDSVIANGLPQQKIDDFLSNYKASETFNMYSASGIADELGMAEYYFHNYGFVDEEYASYQSVTQADIKRVAAKYFSADHVDLINIKPQE